MALFLIIQSIKTQKLSKKKSRQRKRRVRAQPDGVPSPNAKVQAEKKNMPIEPAASFEALAIRQAIEIVNSDYANE